MTDKQDIKALLDNTKATLIHSNTRIIKEDNIERETIKEMKMKFKGNNNQSIIMRNLSMINKKTTDT